MKKTLLLAALLAFSATGFADELSSDSTTLSVTVTNAGTLSDHINDALVKKVTNLTVSGPLNSDDITLIRTMAGVATNGYAFFGDEGGVLTNLDISGAQIVAGGSPHYDYWSTETTADNIIGKYMFSRTQLQTVKLPDDAAAIDDEAFYSCVDLTSVNLPAKLKTIGSSAFGYCWSLQELQLPDDLDSIGEGAFMGCNSLETIYFPASLKSFDPYGFAGLSSLKEFIVDDNNENYASVNGVVFSKDLKTLVAYPAGIDSTVYDIPEGTETVGRFAFWGNEHLTDVNIPEGVTSIEESGFNGVKIADLRLPQSLKTIGRVAFGSNSSISIINIPDGVDSIADMAFFACNNVDSLYLGKSVRYIGEDAFSGISAKKLWLPESLEYVGKNGLKSSGLTECQALGTTPAVCEGDVFGIQERKEVLQDNTPSTLYVPAGCTNAYAIAEGFKTFDNIVEMTTTGINSVSAGANANATETARYDLSGKRLSAPTKGINIVKMSDGTVRKVMR